MPLSIEELNLSSCNIEVYNMPLSIEELNLSSDNDEVYNRPSL